MGVRACVAVVQNVCAGLAFLTVWERAEGAGRSAFVSAVWSASAVPTSGSGLCATGARRRSAACSNASLKSVSTGAGVCTGAGAGRRFFHMLDVVCVCVANLIGFSRLTGVVGAAPV